ncbi:AP-4 complex subunit epsilon-1, partial [Perkinsus olseni]
MLADSGDSLPDVLVRVVAWVLGEYGCMCTLSGYTTDDIIDLLAQEVDRPAFTEARVTRGYLFSSMMKLLSQEQQQTANTPSLETVRRVLRKYSTDPDMYQRALEYLKILDGSDPDLLPAAFPYDETNYERSDSLIDVSLSFLDAMVDQAIAEGKKEYGRPNVVDYAAQSSSSFEDRHRALSGLNFTPYSAPTKPSQATVSQPSTTAAAATAAPAEQPYPEPWRATT